MGKFLKGVAPVGFLALVCLPCAGLGLAALGATLAAAGGTLLSPTEGIPTLVVAVLLLGGAAVWYRRRARACGMPQNRSAEEAGRQSSTKRVPSGRLSTAATDPALMSTQYRLATFERAPKAPLELVVGGDAEAAPDVH